MTEHTQSQAIFDRYMRRESSLEQTADALVALIVARKASGASLADLPLRKPDGLALSAPDLARADALFLEMDRRATAG